MMHLYHPLAFAPKYQIILSDLRFKTKECEVRFAIVGPKDQNPDIDVTSESSMGVTLLKSFAFLLASKSYIHIYHNSSV